MPAVTDTPASSPAHYAVLFVCTGNICRSPSAEGVFRKHVREAGLGERVVIESAGTHGYHTGEGADRRSVAAAHQRGYDLAAHRARRLERTDFYRFDLVLALDKGHYATMARMVRPSDGHKLRMLMEFAHRHPGVTEVPDPYYGGPEGFERVLDMLEDASEGLLETVRAGLAARTGG
jgi:protein-tyrosine phosphatase